MSPSSSDRSVNRRTAISAIFGAAAGLSQASRSVAESPARRGRLGLVMYDCGLRRKHMKQLDPAIDLFEPLTFLKHCHLVGAGGMQVSLGVLDGATVKSLRDYADAHELFIEGIVQPPKDDGDANRFEAEIQSAAQVGALAVRTVVMPGRRYEQFNSLAQVREAELRARRMLERAAPIVTKHRVRLAVENHKDQRIEDRVALYEHLACEYIGATVDTGNSFALLDDPYEAIEALSPYAFAVHLKDQALREYEEGFLLGDIPLGQGSFDIPRVVAILQRAKPDIRIALEVITRDALRVPCLSERYWATMPKVSGADLARSLRFVRENTSNRVQSVSTLTIDEQVKLEDANIAASLAFASEHLTL
ncbi:MAG: TIM barrel protein [Pirellulaceae bacterium]